MTKWQLLFRDGKPIIGMVHVQALPGTPTQKYDLQQTIEIAVQEAQLYEKAGIHAIMIENMHDVPYLNTQVGPEITSAMTAIACAVHKNVGVPLGIQILAAANKEALAVAHAAHFDFIRAEGFVFAHVADEGTMNSCAGTLLRYRKHIGAESIAILTDIKKKHSSHAITADVSIGDTAKAAEFFLSDGVILTGTSTGKEADLNELKEIKNKASLPTLIGSGITIDNLKHYWKYADGFIVGSYFKEDGCWENPISITRLTAFLKEADRLSKSYYCTY